MRHRYKELSLIDDFKIIDNLKYLVTSINTDNKKIFPIAKDKIESICAHVEQTGLKNKFLKDNKKSVLVCVSLAALPAPSTTKHNKLKMNIKKLVSKIYATKCKSIVTYTIINKILGDKIKLKTLKPLCQKYISSYIESFKFAVKYSFDKTAIYKSSITNLSFKAKIIG